MIVNSQPYNPSRPTQSHQQQRCVGLEPTTSTSISTLSSSSAASTTMSRLMASMSTGSSQQNSLYGSAFAPHPQQQTASQLPNSQSSHMHDLMANLQQNVFDSTYDIATSANMNANLNDNNSSTNKQMNDLTRRRAGEQASHQQQLHQNDISLYSPSSSTSLLYHIYDQINLPSEQYQQQQQQRQELANNLVTSGGGGGNANINKKQANTTILNPANLFSQPPTGQNQLPLPLPMQMHHQHQLSEFQQKTLATNQHHHQSSLIAYNNNNTTQYPLQQPFSNTLHQQSTYVTGAGGQQQNLMLDTLMRQQQQQQRHHHQRPLSSSGASSMSGQSATIAYGRQPRTMNTMKGQGHNLASALQSSNTLSHHHLHHHLPGLPAGPNAAKLNLLAGSPWKRLGQRARHAAREYSTIVKCLIFLIISAFTLMSIIKFTLPTSASSTSSSKQATSNSQVLTNGNLPATYPHPLLIYPGTSSHQNPAFGEQPPNKQPATADFSSDNYGQAASAGADQMPTDEQQQNGAQQPQEMLKSKLLTCKFVILNQNYSHSQAQRSLLAERIVKLMDQVFLATDVRRVYLRMDVTKIRPNRPSGIVVDCNIVLSESIQAAAQQFGLALYESLVKSHERLANQNYIVDKSSIAFNIVPDKDLKSGIVPQEFTRLIGPVAPSTPDQSPFDDRTNIRLPSETSGPSSVSSDFGSDSSSTNPVVWTEWSPWSSCFDKNGICDEARIHSRLRECVSQHTGERVNATLCKERFNLQDLNIEVDNCARTCRQQLDQQPQVSGQHYGQQPDGQTMSDAPIAINNGGIGPQTAPSVMIAGNEPPASFTFTPLVINKPPNMSAITSSINGRDGNNKQDQAGASSTVNSNLMEIFTPPAVGGSLSNSVSSTTTERNSFTGASVTNDISGSSAMPPTMLPPIEMPTLANNNAQQQPISCSNCTSDEVCLLLMQAKVPFCAKVKDRSDESGCGGWCKAQSQLCQPVGHQAYKCIHDSECLPDEFRCHDSVCIPLSKRCDGHANCYDSSDERDCPMPT